MKFVVIQEVGGRWVWELRQEDGEPVCRSTKGFKDRQQLCETIQAVRAKTPQAPVFDPLGTLYEGV